jgi:hypothetical protein
MGEVKCNIFKRIVSGRGVHVDEATVALIIKKPASFYTIEN